MPINILQRGPIHYSNCIEIVLVSAPKELYAIKTCLGLTCVQAVTLVCLSTQWL